MTASPPNAFPAAGSIRLLWAQSLATPARGLALAREKDWLLAWDDTTVTLLNQAGRLQSQVRLHNSVGAATCADDGSAIAAVGSGGEVWWLAPDLSTRWERAVAGPGVTAALDPFGQYLAVADAKGGVTVFDRLGRNVCQVLSPRHFHYMTWVPGAPYLIGSSDFGLVACLDLAGRWVWRDGLVIHAGSLTVTGDGSVILLACFTEGLQRYNLAGKNEGRLAVVEPCRLAALSFDGSVILAAGLSNRLLLLDRAGQLLNFYSLDRPPDAIALSPLGDRAFAALPDGRVVGLDLHSVPPG
jgi:hypothetical protein